MQLPAGLLIDRFGVARLLPAIAALAPSFEISTRGLPTNRVGTAIAVVSLGGVAAGVVLEIIPGLVAENMEAAPLSTLQMANAIFALSIALAVGATHLLPKRA